MSRVSNSPRATGSPSGVRRGLGIVAAAAAAVAVTTTLTGHNAVARADDPAAPSAGCGATATAAGSSTHQFAAAGETGHYLLDVPPGADRPTPVVFDLHGYLEPAELERSSSGLGDFGSKHGFVTVTPQIDEPGLPRWDFTPGSADVDYLSDLIGNVASTLCVDQRRVYVAGLSMGAFTTSALACRLSDRIAAVAPVAGLQDFDWCHPTRPVPVVAFHGTGDPIVSYTGGPGPNAAYLPAPDGSTARAENGGPAVNGPGPQSVPDDAVAWARRNGCGTTPARQHVTPDVDLTTFDCPADGTVELYSVLGGGHTWPSGSLPSPEALTGSTTHSIDANQIMWDFFQAHPMPR
ncbi:alpha/beta hydrolase family esterase [Nocardia sp. alder85J]|uniref:alpha/beta hydrolase family esterase n=1 Tax=Nocardia sp. alder85J TaxID=2862949 RepID=UPI001CD532BF|nr:PHB depolymerase family esterase [Nocardia sp. alder85J]MCX4092395.1 hypothetical protein [Nocardia sp. alder85J]